MIEAAKHEFIFLLNALENAGQQDRPARSAVSFRDIALALVQRGFSVIPIAPRGKAPIGPGAKNATQDVNLVEHWSTLWPEANVGICADERITILESDDAARLKSLLSDFGVVLPITLTGGASENRPHWFYKRTPECGDSCITVPGLFEFRNVNQYVVGPGSVHPSGAPYKFWNDAPMGELPPAVLAVLQALAAGYSGEARSEHIAPGPYSDLRAAYLKRLDPADLVALAPLEVAEGERHYTLMSLAGLIHDGERDEETLKGILLAVQDRHFVGAKGYDEIDNIVRSIIKRAPCLIEPYDLPSYSMGLRVFKSAEAQAAWIVANTDDFAVAWEYLNSKSLEVQRVLVTLKGEPAIREETVSEIFAFRGLGKSMLVGSLISILTKGGEFLGFQSSGGNRVLLVDGELPERLLQSRLRDLVGTGTAGLFRVRSLSQVKNNRMPGLAAEDAQKDFVAHLGAWRPDVIIFDTRTAVFKHDTNDGGQLLAVNEFLMQLRAQGFAVILTHHAGKNGTQRGRTDNDDITDLIIKLKQRNGWTPGNGLEFTLAFEKVRYGDRLEGFDASWSPRDGWKELYDRDAEAINELMKGTGINSVAKKFEMSNRKVAKLKEIAEARKKENT